MWALHAHLIANFECYTEFKYERCDVPRRIPGTIRWFVPSTHPNKAKVIAFLENELSHERIAPCDYGAIVEPGRLVEIFEAAPTVPYMEKSLCDAVAKELLASLLKDRSEEE